MRALLRSVYIFSSSPQAQATTPLCGVVACEVVVTSRDVTKMFEVIERAFDGVPSPIQPLLAIMAIYA